MAAEHEIATFNAAVSAGDWPLVVVLGEAALAQGSASQAIRYNLALAYVKTTQPALAVSVLVGSDDAGADRQSAGLLEDAMRQSGVGATAIEWVRRDKQEGIHQWQRYPDQAAAASAICFLFFGLAFLSGIYARKKGRGRNPAIRAVAMVAGFCGVVFLIFFGACAVFRSEWGAVVARGGAVIHGAADQSAPEIQRLNYGDPVKVTGDIRGPWLNVSDINGNKGWISALEVRVVPDEL